MLNKAGMASQESGPSQIEVADSDDDTAAPPSEDELEFIGSIMCFAEDFEDFRTVVASWLVRLGDHPYFAGITADLSEFVMTLTMSASRLQHVVQSGQSMALNRIEKSRMLKEVTEESAKALEKFTEFKAIVLKMIGAGTTAAENTDGTQPAAEPEAEPEVEAPAPKKARKDD